MSLFSLNTYTFVCEEQKPFDPRQAIDGQMALITKILEGMECSPQNPLSGITVRAMGCEAALERLQKLVNGRLRLNRNDIVKIEVALNTVKKIGENLDEAETFTSRVKDLAQRTKSLDADKKRGALPKRRHRSSLTNAVR